MVKVAITIDIDWAPEDVIEDSLNLCEEFGVKATLFVTHESKLIKSRISSQIELGLHPNYLPMLQGDQKFDASKPLESLKKIYPEAVGVRTHGLAVTPAIIGAIRSNGFIYDSSLLVMGEQCAGPFELFPEFYRIPIHWEDDVHFEQGGDFQFSEKSIKQGCTVFNFHPIHIYLNTESPNTYLKAKEFYQNPVALIKLRNTKIEGTRDYFIALLSYIRNSGIKSVLLKDMIGLS